MNIKENKNDYLNNREKELAELLNQLETLDNQRRKIMKRVNSLKTSLRYYGIYTSDRTKENTEIYKMFGKTKNDLTNEELKIYNRERQRAHRKIKM